MFSLLKSERIVWGRLMHICTTLGRGCLVLLACSLLGSPLFGQRQDPAAKWSFLRSEGATPADSIRGVKGTLSGFFQYVGGVSGDAIRFDGYTTRLVIPAKDAPEIGQNGFTVDAWVALNTYPWNWAPVVDQEVTRQSGFFLGIDAFGHISLQASIDGQWQMVISTAKLPLKKWAHITASYETSHAEGTMTLYLDGTPVGQLAVHGDFSPATNTDLLIGRIRQATMPFPEAEIKPQYPVWYSLDGILDEVALYAHGLDADEVAQAHRAVKAPAGDVLPWQKMPSGSLEPGRFGAYYASLKYQDTWDRLRRIGPEADVVVRFDQSPVRLVFWQGTNYIPAWVTDNDKWYTDEFLETWESGCPGGGDCEPMSDKQSRYAHVNIVESNDARAIVHWRYALAEVEKYEGAWPDPNTGWFDWADEYWTIYPDGIAIRKQVLHTDDVNRLHEWQETIVLHQPGFAPEDDINLDAITLENMHGETRTYTWRPKRPGQFSMPYGPPVVDGPVNPAIQIVNIKSDWKPFQIISPEGSGADIYNNEKTYFDFLCWNHWPVAQIASSDRACVTSDRASHSSLSHLYWKFYAKDENSATKILMAGLTKQKPAELLPLAKSWLSPAPVELEGTDYHYDGYDPTQRAYAVTNTQKGKPGRLALTLQASDASPVYDPVILIKGWGEGRASLTVSGKAAPWGKSFRMGYVQHMEGADLVIWMEKQSTTPLHIEVIPAAQ